MKPWKFEDITKPLAKAVRFAYSVKRKNKTKNIPWSGPKLTINRILCCSPNINEQFTEDTLEYHKESDKDALDVIIMCAVQLGIEQGIRMKMEDLNRYKMFIREFIDSDKIADRIDLYISESGLS